VIPAAGRGSRLYPATKSQAKEMLPLGTKPVIQHVVEELAEAGVRQILIVTGRKKRAIEDHFDGDPRWLEELSNGEFDGDLWHSGIEIFYTRQSHPLGLGDAILRAKAFCGCDPFVVALGDSLIVNRGRREGPGVTERLVETFDANKAAGAVATYRVALADTKRYGIVAPADEVTGTEAFALRDIVEKPGPEKAPSRWAVAARYVLCPDIFDEIAAGRESAGPGEEVQLTAAIRGLLGRGPVYGVPLRPDEFRLDVGDFATYGRSFARMMAADARHGKGFVEYLRHLLAYVDGAEVDPDAWAADEHTARSGDEGQ
jgi:UTP--glucose-1-phosphate uridylyltransferase